MQKLDVWRWAQYTLVGMFFIVLLVLSFVWAVKIDIEPFKGHGALILAGLLFIAYLAGMIIWDLSICFSQILVRPIFCLYRSRSYGKTHYHDYRFHLFKNNIEKIKNARREANLDFDEQLGKDIPDYRHLLLEVFRCSNQFSGYLGDKLVSGWQSSTLILSLLGALFSGAIVASGVMVYFAVYTSWSIVPVQLGKILVMLVVYFLIGLSFLERNRLLARDVAFSYILRQEAQQSHPADQAQSPASQPPVPCS